MSIAEPPSGRPKTVAELIDQLGGVSPERIRLQPYPGMATVEDVVRIEQDENRLFELVDGVLVEKVMGYTESRLAIAIAAALERYLEANDLGAISGADGMFRLPENLVRIPDVAFASWDSFPDDETLADAVPEIAPDLAVEVLSKGNTHAEMSRKLREYFRAGVRLVWFVDPPTKSVRVYTSTTRSSVIPYDGILDGGDVLPGFALPVSQLFARLQPPRRRGKR